MKFWQCNIWGPQIEVQTAAAQWGPNHFSINSKSGFGLEFRLDLTTNWLVIGLIFNLESRIFRTRFIVIKNRLYKSYFKVKFTQKNHPEYVRDLFLKPDSQPNSVLELYTVEVLFQALTPEDGILTKTYPLIPNHRPPIMLERPFSLSFSKFSFSKILLQILVLSLLFNFIAKGKSQLTL